MSDEIKLQSDDQVADPVTEEQKKEQEANEAAGGAETPDAEPAA